MSTALTRGRDECATATLLAALTRGLSVVREPRLVRARFEEELRALLEATSISRLLFVRSARQLVRLDRRNRLSKCRPTGRRVGACAPTTDASPPGD